MTGQWPHPKTASFVSHPLIPRADNSPQVLSKIILYLQVEELMKEQCSLRKTGPQRRGALLMKKAKLVQREQHGN